MKKALVVLIDGFEEIEALATVDILRRAGMTVKTVSLTGDLLVTGAHQIPVEADLLFEDGGFHGADILIIPGGTPKYDTHEGLKKRLKECVEGEKFVAAICAAPMVLGGLGLLEGKKVTCYPGFEEHLKGADIQKGASVVVDGKIITGRGPAFAIEFALVIIGELLGEEKRKEVAKGLLIEE